MPKSRTNPSAAPKKSAKKTPPTQDEIALRAYQIYVERGGTPGDPMEDWLQAECELSAAVTSKPGRKSKIVSIAA